MSFLDFSNKLGRGNYWLFGGGDVCFLVFLLFRLLVCLLVFLLVCLLVSFLVFLLRCWLGSGGGRAISGAVARLHIRLAQTLAVKSVRALYYDLSSANRIFVLGVFFGLFFGLLVIGFVLFMILGVMSGGVGRSSAVFGIFGI